MNKRIIDQCEGAIKELEYILAEVRTNGECDEESAFAMLIKSRIFGLSLTVDKFKGAKDELH